MGIPMETWIIALLGALFFILIFSFWHNAKQFREIRAREEKNQAFLLLQQQIDSLRDQVGRSLDGNVQLVHQQLTALSSQVTNHLNAVSSRLSEQVGTGMGLIQKASQHFSDRVQEVQTRLAQLDEANKRILEVGRSIASLQEILRAPKVRGGLGEFLLGDLLAQIMPAEYFTLQHSFKSGERVDAVIRLSQGLVPVDAKFPLENFQKSLLSPDEGARKGFLKLFAVDVKKHVESIANKYILPMKEPATSPSCTSRRRMFIMKPSSRTKPSGKARRFANMPLRSMSSRFRPTVSMPTCTPFFWACEG